MGESLILLFSNLKVLLLCGCLPAATHVICLFVFQLHDAMMVCAECKHSAVHSQRGLNRAKAKQNPARL